MKSFVPNGIRLVFASRKAARGISSSMQSAFHVKTIKFQGRFRKALEIVGGKGNFVPTGNAFLKLPGYRDFRESLYCPTDILAITSLDGKLVEENPYLLEIGKLASILRHLTNSKT